MDKEFDRGGEPTARRHADQLNERAPWGMGLVVAALNRPRAVLHLTWMVTLAVVLLAALPSLFPATFAPLNPLKVDADPENMLSEQEAVRVFHNRMKETMRLHDLVLVGIVNETDPDGVFNPQTLSRIHELTHFAGELQWPSKTDPNEQIGVIRPDMMSPASVDAMEPDGPGSIRFDWLMFDPPDNRQQALAIRDKALRIPMFNGTLVGEGGKAVALYLPVTSKDISYRVASALEEKIAGFEGDDRFYITGMPVAQDAFGVEMFIQMAISAPAAMLVIFGLMYYFFRNLTMIVSPMLVAMASVMVTMGLLVAFGNTVHIMSSMIPIFIMPIAVLDSVHVLSEFFDRYPRSHDRRATMQAVMRDLFKPMLYTTLTTSVAFLSLVLAPIPPVQVFGIFVAAGVVFAWFITITLVPAWVMRMPEEKLRCLGEPKRRLFVEPKVDSREAAGRTLLGRVLARLGEYTRTRPRRIALLAVLSGAVGVWGILQIQVNDNPIRWFTEDHPIRVADGVLNEHFGGSYMAYLTLSPALDTAPGVYARELAGRLRNELADEPGGIAVADALEGEIAVLSADAGQAGAVLDGVERLVREQSRLAAGETAEAWEKAYDVVDGERVSRSLFKQPALLEWMEDLQQSLLDQGVAGNAVSVAEIVKAVYRDLEGGGQEYYRIPDSSDAVAQSLFMFQNSNRAHDLWHFVTEDYRRVAIWLQLKSGDNIDMARLEDAVARYMSNNPPPLALNADWFGLTYINKAWQEKMVVGMGNALAGSFLVVLVMMVMLFRSLLWGLLAMIPLSVSITLIYGIIGLIGKDYDMPVAVLSALALGLAVDFAIHFLVRTRARYEQVGNLPDTVRYVFEGPALAIMRNALVVSIGFLPLLLAPLVPYNTVGILIASILMFSALGSLIILSSLVATLERPLFARSMASNMATEPVQG